GRLAGNTGGQAVRLGVVLRHPRLLGLLAQGAIRDGFALLHAVGDVTGGPASEPDTVQIRVAVHGARDRSGRGVARATPAWRRRLLCRNEERHNRHDARDRRCQSPHTVHLARGRRFYRELKMRYDVVVFEVPVLTRARILSAYGVAGATDILQLVLGPVGWTMVDEVLDVAAMLVISRLIGFHALLLPTFVLELVPLADLLPT